MRQAAIDSGGTACSAQLLLSASLSQKATLQTFNWFVVPEDHAPTKSKVQLRLILQAGVCGARFEYVQIAHLTALSLPRNFEHQKA